MLQLGVGTITFYEPETKEFAALGHGILDVDTNKLINIGKGELVTSKILSITKLLRKKVSFELEKPNENMDTKFFL